LNRKLNRRLQEQLVQKNSFLNYSTEHVHFYGTDIPRLLEMGLTLTTKSLKEFNLLDLGCGDGGLIFALHHKGFLANAGKIVGVDISKKRIERLQNNLRFVKGIVADALDVRQLPSRSFDFVVCAQLIEHVENDRALVREIGRLLKHGGFAFVSSVIKKWWGFYIYFNHGSFRLDPTHVREYASKQELLDVFAHEELEIVKVQTEPVRFPIADALVRMSIRVGLMQPDAEFYQTHKGLNRLRRLKMEVPGYQIVEVLAKKIRV
jgi:2-polyprenyl-3-methyl-5-hydroxy-6-metoxy-1,4-benzoquinol methylase